MERKIFDTIFRTLTNNIGTLVTGDILISNGTNLRKVFMPVLNTKTQHDMHSQCNKLRWADACRDDRVRWPYHRVKLSLNENNSFNAWQIMMTKRIKMTACRHGWTLYLQVQLFHRAIIWMHQGFISHLTWHLQLYFGFDHVPNITGRLYLRMTSRNNTTMTFPTQPENLTSGHILWHGMHRCVE